jgi:hypothetical protein
VLGQGSDFYQGEPEKEALGLTLRAVTKKLCSGLYAASKAVVRWFGRDCAPSGFGTAAGTRAAASRGCSPISSEALPLLEDSWLAVLKKHGMVELHMKEFVPPHGKLSRWSEKQKRAVLEPLIDLVHEHNLVGIGTAVEMTEFMTTSQAFAHSKSPDLVEGPYQWCLRYCMVQVGAWAEKAGIN